MRNAGKANKHKFYKEQREVWTHSRITNTTGERNSTAFSALLNSVALGAVEVNVKIPVTGVLGTTAMVL